MASKLDYDWLYERLKTDNKVTFMEFEEGHLGLLLPKRDVVSDSLFEQVMIYQALIEFKKD